MEITAIILTYNEQKHIERCVHSLLPITNRIFVVDSFSTDDTVKIARSFGAEVVQREWKNYADQFQWGLDHCDVQTDWVMRIDADEYVEEELQMELMKTLPGLSKDVSGIYIRRKVFFQGQWIKYGGFYPHKLLRIWRVGFARIEHRWMDAMYIAQI